jgi:hypothetical protein
LPIDRASVFDLHRAFDISAKPTAWLPYRIRTSMCGGKIHLFDMSRKFEFRRLGGEKARAAAPAAVIAISTGTRSSPATYPSMR